MAQAAHRRYAEIMRDVEGLINDHSEPDQKSLLLLQVLSMKPHCKWTLRIASLSDILFLEEVEEAAGILRLSDCSV
jgi:hypothetical protein